MSLGSQPACLPGSRAGSEQRGQLACCAGRLELSLSSLLMAAPVNAAAAASAGTHPLALQPRWPSGAASPRLAVQPAASSSRRRLRAPGRPRMLPQLASRMAAVAAAATAAARLTSSCWWRTSSGSPCRRRGAAASQQRQQQQVALGASQRRRNRKCDECCQVARSTCFRS